MYLCNATNKVPESRLAYIRESLIQNAGNDKFGLMIHRGFFLIYRNSIIALLRNICHYRLLHT